MNDSHGISDRQWLDFMDGPTHGVEHARIAAHLEQCAACSQILQELTEWRSRLSAEGQRLRVALELPDAARERMLAESLARVNAMTLSEAVPRRRVAAEGIAMLRSLLGPVFGAGAMRAAVETALRGAAPDDGSAASWMAFAARLREAIQSICGQAAGHLAERAAMSLAVSD